MTSDHDLITLEEIAAAHARIRPFIDRTPLIELTKPSIIAKAESLQSVGSFKIRGAMNTLLCLDADQQRRGVVAHSSGNHAIAVAHAGAVLGVAVTVVMPRDAPAIKLSRTLKLGAQVITVGPGSDERTERAAQLQHEQGLTPVEPYDSREVLTATATIAVEILEDLRHGPSPVIYVPVSGGGLAGGIAAAAKLLAPSTRVIAVEPEVAADYLASRQAGERVSLPAAQMAKTAADGLRVQQVGVLPWIHLQAFVDDAVTVSEDAIRQAQRWIFTRTGLVAEPSGAVSVAAAAVLQTGTRRVAVITGSNTDPSSERPGNMAERTVETQRDSPCGDR